MTRAAALLLALTAAAPTQEPARMTRTAAGRFDVTMTPAANGPAGDFTLAKTYHGPLAATSTGRMLSAGDPANGSAGYVAMEAVTGTLDGRAGGFTLQHSGIMDAGAQSLTVTVVPGSGTGALKGLNGTMEIRLEGGRHDYTLRYALPG